MKKIKVAVIGIGHLGKIHARVYSEFNNVELAVLCDVDKTKTQHFLNNEFGGIICNDYKEVLGKVNAVSIATPTSTHFEIAKFFLKNKVHVLVEKPITATTNEAETLINLARRYRVILQVGHVERFNPAIGALRQFCKNPKFIECHRLSPYPKRGTDVNVVLDLMIHDIDIILSLVKSDLKICQAIGVNVLSAHADIANARLEFKNGTVCNLTASRVSDDMLRKIRIFQQDSYLSLDYASQMITFYEKNSFEISKKEIVIPKKEPLVEELKSFISCIQKRKEPVVRGQDAKEALQIALLITKQINKNPLFCPKAKNKK
ncbi:MAG: Gfo/Idh/MocA family oxidoreductase [Candidatus Omnitrophica bacterium]|nr:Gfo/Idh/MocA family oxidoreductase [Candidatus Omnitrophota bacterium]MBU1924940.1 Gfo/Idh/MocA family oxidoreductase [Candidatus Omnitrophota bacterium]